MAVGAGNWEGFEALSNVFVGRWWSWPAPLHHRRGASWPLISTGVIPDLRRR